MCCKAISSFREGATPLYAVITAVVAADTCAAPCPVFLRDCLIETLFRQESDALTMTSVLHTMTRHPTLWLDLHT